MSNEPRQRDPDPKTRALVEIALKQARRQITEDGEARPVFMVCHAHGVEVIFPQFTNGRDKELAALAVRELAALHEAHTVLFVSEIWTLPDSVTAEQAEALRAKYTSVEAMPGRIEVVRVAAETRPGPRWDCFAPILRNGRAVKLGPTKYRDMTDYQVAGRFAGWFAPAREVPAPGSLLRDPPAPPGCHSGNK